MSSSPDHNPIKAKAPGGGTPGAFIKTLEGLLSMSISFAGLDPCVNFHQSARRLHRRPA